MTTPTHIYIAGPMTGLPGNNSDAFFTAARELRGPDRIILNPAALEDIHGEGHPYEFYLREALKILLQCDAVALLPGWQNSRGATLEERIAQACGMDVRDLADWLTPTPPSGASATDLTVRP